MKDNILPEEKLLRLIRGKKKQEVKPAILSPFDTHKIIWIFFVAACIYLGISFIYPFLWLKKIKLPPISQGKITGSKIESKAEVKPYEFYQKGIANKQLFGGVFSLGIEKPITVGADFMKEISLVGIIAGENPQAIIEDKKAQKTYYLSKGQFIGEFQLEGIGEGKIILNYNGQRYELYL